MSSPTQTKQTPDGGAEQIPPLVNGDHLDQPTFHQRYEAMPEGTKAELIGGIVYMHSPAKRPHTNTHSFVDRWLGAYNDATPGTEVHLDASNLLGPESEPQPDVCLLISPENGGQTVNKDGWIVGPPELIVEIASSTESIDLHRKKIDYQKAGVREYVVLAMRQRRIYWFVESDEALTESAPGDGLYRSTVFPGLWLDGAALLRGEMRRVHEALAAGLATPEHAAFVARLAAASGGAS